jgi:hypothetical protein
MPRDTVKAVGLFDHRPVFAKLSLNSLCNGWIEYPATPLTRPRIQRHNISEEQNKIICAAVQDWKTKLPSHLRSYLLSSSERAPGTPRPIEEPLSELHLVEMHQHLTQLFVNIPGAAYDSGPHARRQKVYKSLLAGKAQHVLCWLQHYKLMLANLYDAKIRGARNLTKALRRECRRVRTQSITNLLFEKPSLKLRNRFPLASPLGHYLS